jgi:hypothetical protein
MPQPIVPIHQQENMSILFGDSMQPEFQLSEIQNILLQPSAVDKGYKKVAVNAIKALESIDKNTDLIVTAVSNSNERFCTVPSEIDDNALLALKADGLISGYGRSVKITERGRTALRDHYLSSRNSMNENKSKEKFDYKSSVRVSFKKP